ncbi:hypothetical protein LTR37_010945 [Vermiconidia calcicola]|uniref:Uncharacterized protein n=1 Tax=Vermiconidia calcicola TaxID=1690605 RepID=A0ACC3N550_9PEZI|nr:hypothetical protein LTR37_010945 [Vermiconidia calcicola]
MLKVAIIFTIACLLLSTNAFLSIFPFLGFQGRLPHGIIYLEGVLSVLSCALFLTGSTFAFLETLSANNRPIEFYGWGFDYASVESDVEKGSMVDSANDTTRVPPANDLHWTSSLAAFFKHYRDIEPPALEDEKDRKPLDFTRSTPNASRSAVPSPQRDTSCYLDLNFLASLLFVGGSFVYLMTSLASLATIFTTGTVATSIRYPQLCAAIGFVLGSLILLLKIQKERQGRWWKPAIRVLGWHVNFWNLLGSTGFIFCASFGLLTTAHWADLHLNASYLWGSWGFLLASALQCYKARHKKAYT